MKTQREKLKFKKAKTAFKKQNSEKTQSLKQSANKGVAVRNKTETQTFLCP